MLLGFLAAQGVDFTLVQKALGLMLGPPGASVAWISDRRGRSCYLILEGSEAPNACGKLPVEDLVRLKGVGKGDPVHACKLVEIKELSGK